MATITVHIVQAPEGTFAVAHYGEAGEFLTPAGAVPIQWEDQ